MRKSLPMRMLFFLLLLHAPSFLFGQSQGEEDQAREVEIREIEPTRDGSVADGSIPDSLDRKYFFHDNGKVYKHFSIYEQALAHFRGYYPRDEVETEENVVYISSAPTVEGPVPKALKVRPGKRVEAIR